MFIRLISISMFFLSLYAQETTNLPTSSQLIRIHIKSLKQYHNKNLRYQYERIDNAIKEFSTLDLQHMQKPSDMTCRQFASILNDYGVLLMQDGKYDEAIGIYTRAIKFDNSHAIVYLNLGNVLREKLSFLNSYQEKIEMNKQVKSAYQSYKKFGGKRNSQVEDFLNYNIIDTPHDDICRYIADYTNRGRLKELYGSGESIEREDSNGTMKIEIRSMGTGHYDNIFTVDKATNEEKYYEDEYFPNHESHVIPFQSNNYILYADWNEYLFGMSPIGKRSSHAKACKFENKVTFTFTPQSDPKLCPLLLTSKHPPFLPFKKDEEESYEYGSNAVQTGISVNKIDFDNDGEKDILSMEHTPLTDQSSEYTFFVLETPEGDNDFQSPKAKLLLKMQNMYYEKIDNDYDKFRWGPTSSGNKTGWFKYKNLTYYETRFKGKTPECKEDEFFKVSYIKNGKIHRVCDAKFTKTVIIKENP